MKSLLVLGVAVACALSFSLAFAGNPAPAVVNYTEGPQGKVEFTHQKHSTGYQIECAECHHHETESTPQPKNCLECHPCCRLKAPGKICHADALHQQCKGCHLKREKGPQAKCNDCHKK